VTLIDRSKLAPLHNDVLTSWRKIVVESKNLGLADRIVIALKLQKRAEALATYEGLALGAGDLATDSRAFAASVKEQSPLTWVLAVYGLVTAVLGFFG
jgi:hypothetical protein